MTGSRPPNPVILFSLTAGIILAAWWWLGAPVAMPSSPLQPGEKLYCLSYAPFHGSQTPLDPTTMIEPAQIDQDFAQLAKITDCVRSYSVDFGLDRVPEMASKHGLKVLLGVWISGKPERNTSQIAIGVDLAKKYPDVVRAVIVGNEVLLRGEISAAGLADALRTVKSQITQPVTYADVWEFWLRHRELANLADFVMIHILPYWEDDPISAQIAADHVASIRRNVAAEFPGKEIVIGETGWPSAGRMRESALPSPANQARVVQDILARGKRDNFRVNIIEAYDQPWKRAFEGTVGGHWGLLDDANRAFKFAWGEPVSNHPHWPWQAAGGIVLAALIFGAGLKARTNLSEPTRGFSCGLLLMASAAGIFVAWAVESALVESLGVGGWIRSIALLVVAIVAPILCAAALRMNLSSPTFARVLAKAEDRARSPFALTLGLILIVLAILAAQTAFGLVFDPRYRDFPTAALTAATVPFLLLSFIGPRSTGGPAVAEFMFAAAFALSATFIAINETYSNWQALWLCAALIALAVSLARVRAAPD